MARHQINFKYGGAPDDIAIEMAFGKDKADDRKKWLTDGMEERKRRRLNDEPEIFLYKKDTKQVTYSEFVNKELILFSNADNERSIPSMVDGKEISFHFSIAEIHLFLINVLFTVTVAD